MLFNSGCASVFGNTADAQTSSAQSAAAVVTRTVYRLNINAPDELATLLRTHLDLARFQSVPAADAITPTELDRLALAAPAQARGLLETEGYFDADVAISRGSAGADGLPTLTMTVQPGPRTTVQGVNLLTEGALNEAAQAGDALAQQTLASWQKNWALPAGQPFTQGAWSSAKSGALAQLRAEGYPAASWKRTVAQVDAPEHSANLTLLADSAALYRLGALRIEGLQRYPDRTVRNLAAFNTGVPYSEKLLFEYQERLQKVGLFETASVEIDPNPDTAGAAPVIVRVTEQPQMQATVGVGVSTNTGPRVTLEHLNRRLFGWDWVAKNKLEVAALLRSWSGELTSHPLANQQRNLLAASIERDDSSDQTLTSWRLRAGRSQDTPRFERLIYGEYINATLKTATSSSQNNAVSINYDGTLRALDSVLLPTTGSSLSAETALGYARGGTIAHDDGSSTEAKDGVFTRLTARYTWYKPLGASWYANARLQAGQVFAARTVGVPDSLLFRAGGDESVRGYGYRTLGPTVAGTLSSGRVLMTASAEIARPISPRLPAFWWATFVDAGNAAATWGDLKPSVGYGVGLRWRSPVGPLRLDLAHGVQVHANRLHLSVGIAF
ncbi:MAG: hypothetical protein RJA98_2673 [Pseudomonadota bacterium]